MLEPSVSRMLAAAAAMLLRPPDALTLTALVESRGIILDLASARQDYYDVLCVPQSGRYIPPYAHVLAQGRVRNDDWWHFPPPRYDGGDALAPWYEAVGFDPLQLDADPMLKGSHRPLDNTGFIVAYLAGLIASREAAVVDAATADPIIVAFMAEHVDTWLDRFCDLLGGSGSPYLESVAEAVREAVQATHESCPIPILESASTPRASPQTTRIGA
jgi:hypothetical protein